MIHHAPYALLGDLVITYRAGARCKLNLFGSTG
jgi:hypothetical protein